MLHIYIFGYFPCSCMLSMLYELMCGHWTTVVFIELLRRYWTNEKAHLHMLSQIGADQRHEGS